MVVRRRQNRPWQLIVAKFLLCGAELRANLKFPEQEPRCARATPTTGIRVGRVAS